MVRSDVAEGIPEIHDALPAMAVEIATKTSLEDALPRKHVIVGEPVHEQRAPAIRPQMLAPQPKVARHHCCSKLKLKYILKAHHASEPGRGSQCQEANEGTAMRETVALMELHC